MKKLVFMFVAVATMSFAVSFSSCNGTNTTADTATKADSDTMKVVEPANGDTLPGDTLPADSANKKDSIPA